MSIVLSEESPEEAWCRACGEPAAEGRLCSRCADFLRGIRRQPGGDAVTRHVAPRDRADKIVITGASIALAVFVVLALSGVI